MWWYDDRPLVGKRTMEKRTARRRRGGKDLNIEARITGQSKKGRRRFGVLISITVVVAGLIWLALMGTQTLAKFLFTDNEEYLIRRFELHSDGRLKPWHIREYAGLKEGQNLFAVDLERIRRDLESVPLVSDAEVCRRLPDTLVVKVKERVALARLGVGNDTDCNLAVDRQGYVLGPNSASSVLPVITGFSQDGLRPGSYIRSPAVGKALEVLDACMELPAARQLKIQTLDVRNADYLELRLSRGERVLLGKDEIAPRLRKVATIIDACNKMGRVPDLIDVTGDAQIPVRYAP